MAYRHFLCDKEKTDGRHAQCCCWFDWHKWCFFCLWLFHTDDIYNGDFWLLTYSNPPLLNYVNSFFGVLKTLKMIYLKKETITVENTQRKTFRLSWIFSEISSWVRIFNQKSLIPFGRTRFFSIKCCYGLNHH